MDVLLVYERKGFFVRLHSFWVRFPLHCRLAGVHIAWSAF